jgi:hypothetical protein
MSFWYFPSKRVVCWKLKDALSVHGLLGCCGGAVPEEAQPEPGAGQGVDCAPGLGGGCVPGEKRMCCRKEEDVFRARGGCVAGERRVCSG